MMSESMNWHEAQKYFTDRTVIDIKPAVATFCEKKGYIILCRYGNSFVSWWWDGKSNQGHDGHYFDTLAEALVDYKERK